MRIMREITLASATRLTAATLAGEVARSAEGAELHGNRVVAP